MDVKDEKTVRMYIIKTRIETYIFIFGDILCLKALKPLGSIDSYFWFVSNVCGYLGGLYGINGVFAGPVPMPAKERRKNQKSVCDPSGIQAQNSRVL